VLLEKKEKRKPRKTRTKRREEIFELAGERRGEAPKGKAPEQLPKKRSPFSQGGKRGKNIMGCHPKRPRIYLRKKGETNIFKGKKFADKDI